MKRTINIWANLDWLTILMYLLLVMLGWFNIYAAVYDEAHQSIFDISQKYGKQMLWIGAALIVAIIFLLMDSNFYSIFANVIYGTTIFFLVTVLIFGKEVNGARSWFEIGSFRLQPAEFAKFATCLIVARFMSQHNFKIHKLKNLAVLSIIIFVPAILILLQNDTGSALVYSAFVLVLYREGLSGTVLLYGTLLAVLFILTLVFQKLTLFLIVIILAFVIFLFLRQRLKDVGVAVITFVIASFVLWGINTLFSFGIQDYLIVLAGFCLASIQYLVWAYRLRLAYIVVIIGIVLGAIAFTFTVDYIFQNVLEVHQRDRINNLLGIESDPLGAGYNVNQSKIAIGSGGFMGKGFLQGTQTKFNFVPEQSTDFIFCTVGEEWGFVGAAVVILLFVLFLLRLIFLAERQRSAFSRIYGYGVVTIIFFHVAVNIGMTIGLAPVIGIPLPFFSYGGSSLWAFTIMLFIFLRLDASRTEMLN